MSQQPVEAFLRLPLSEALQRNILWDNWARLYGVGERRAGRALLLRLCLVEVGDEVLDALEVAAMCLPNLLFVGGFEQHDLVVEFGRSSLDLQCKAALHSHLNDTRRAFADRLQWRRLGGAVRRVDLRATWRAPRGRHPARGLLRWQGRRILPLSHTRAP